MTKSSCTNFDVLNLDGWSEYSSVLVWGAREAALWSTTPANSGWLALPVSMLCYDSRDTDWGILLDQANSKLTEQQLASLSSPRAVKEFLATQRENITNIIKQNLAVGDIFKRENLQVHHSHSHTLTLFSYSPLRKRQKKTERIKISCFLGIWILDMVFISTEEPWSS